MHISNNYAIIKFIINMKKSNLIKKLNFLFIKNLIEVFHNKVLMLLFEILFLNLLIF